MTVREYAGPVRLNQLHDEIVAALPGLRAALTVEGWGTSGARLTFPDDADGATIESVVAAHAPDEAYTHDPRRRQAARYLRDTIGPLLPGLIAGTTSLTTAQRDRAIAALCILVKGLYQQD